MESKDYEAALKEFDFALTRRAGGTMLKEATFGKALALKGLMRTQEAKGLFEKIIAAKRWRGVEKEASKAYLRSLEMER